MFESLCVAAIYAATLATIGAATAAWLTGAVPAMADPPAATDGEFGLVRRIAFRSALCLWTLLLVRVIAHSIAIFDLPAALTGQSLWTVAVKSRWGAGWRMQMLAASLAVVSAWWHARAPGRAGRVLASLGAAGFAFALPLSGHSAGSTLHIGIAGAHLLAAGAWLGTLTVLVAVKGGGGVSNQPSRRAAVFQRFSAIAMGGVPIVVASGLVMVWLYLGSVRAIFQSHYGRLLTLKLALFAAICLCGFLNWRRARNGEPLPAARWEVALTAMVVLVTAFLTESAPP